MAYIGKTPITGNFVKLDAISVVNGQAGYTMNNGGSAFTDYENVNQFLVSLNGILQAPTDSFTVSGSTLTFASNLATGDVIDFVIVLGNTLDIGTPSDATVTQAKTNFVTAVLRKESGAAISSEEFTNEDKKYFPQPGDSQELIDQKRQARILAIDTLRMSAGRAIQPQPIVPQGNMLFLDSGRVIQFDSPEKAAAAAKDMNEQRGLN